MTSDFAQVQENPTEKQKEVLKKVIKLKKQIENTENEISKILKENGLNILDVDKYQHDENMDKFLKIKLP